MNNFFHIRRTPETVWVAQQVCSGFAPGNPAAQESTNWWVVDDLPARRALLMCECEERFAQVLQERLRENNQPPSLWRDYYTLRQMGYAEACALAKSLPKANDKPVVATLILPKSRPAAEGSRS